MNPLRFNARIVKIGVLRSVIVPAKIVTALGGEKRIPVVAHYGGDTTKSTLVPAGGATRRLVLQMAVLRAVKLDAGDALGISLTRDASSPRYPLPLDLQRALQLRPAAAAALDRA